MTYSTKLFYIRQRYLMVQDYKERLKIAVIARQYRTSRTTVYRWIKRFNHEGNNGLLDQSHKPKSPHPKALKPQTTKAILRLRKRTHYGPKRLKFYLSKRDIFVSEHAIYKTLLRYGLSNHYRKKKKRNMRSYRVPYPGHTVQMDTKYLDTKPGFPNRLYQYTATDCFTRLRVIRIYDELSAQNTVRFLQEVVQKLPFKISTVRTDNGVEFTYGPFKVDHPLTCACARLNIRHWLNRTAHPESNGRVERSHRTDDEEFYNLNPVKNPHAWKYRISNWERFYNLYRPHQALNNLSPYQYWLKYHKEQEVKNVT
ncbi:MAG: IS481 family transposase [Candidatus Omnitrophica bacterium]|nr:IS481 family transposase [Candidatus Omnitrophota bacterium]